MAIDDPNLPAVAGPPIVNQAVNQTANQTANQAVNQTGVPAEPRPPAGRSLRTAILAGVAGAVVLTGGIIGVVRSRPQPPPVTDPRVKPADMQTPEQVIKTPPPEPQRPDPSAPAGMVAIAGARFAMGSTSEQVDAALALCQKTGTSCRRELYEREQPQRILEHRPPAQPMQHLDHLRAHARPKARGKDDRAE